MKRIFDVLISLIIVIAGFAIIAAIIVFDFIITRQPPIILQKRSVSLREKKLNLFKIRTIVWSQHEKLNKRKISNILKHEEYGKNVPLFCRWLRKSGADEILQVINVLKGEMSLVGPRPLVLEELKIMEEESPELYKRRRVLNSLPGITGYWQIYGDREKGIKNLVELDEYYERNKSLLLDVKIILRTFLVMITATHSDAIISRKNKIKDYKVGIVNSPSSVKFNNI